MAGAYHVKRGLDHPLGGNGYGEDDGTKRIKHPTPSKVLHVRGIPPYMQEHELLMLLSPFGQVVKTFILGEKHQAFVQMDSIDSAARVLQALGGNPAVIGGKQVFFQFSNREEISPPPRSIAASIGGEVKQNETPNKILLVTIDNVRVVVTIEHLYQVFSAYGQVRKIVTFFKNNQLQALVEMDSVESATMARYQLDDKDMFQGCCTLRLAFSKLNELVVKENGPRGRDFSVPYDAQPGGLMSSGGPLQVGHGAGPGGPAGPPLNPAAAVAAMGGLPLGINPAAAAAAAAAAQLAYAYPGAPFEFPGLGYGALPPGMVLGGAPVGGDQTTVLLVNNLNEDVTTPDDLFTLFGVYGDVIRVKILYNKKDSALIQFRDPNQAYLAQLHLNRASLHGKELSIRPSKHREVAMPRSGESAELTKDYSDSPLHRYRRGYGTKNARNIFPPSSALFLSNLSEQATEDDVRELFGRDRVVAVEFFTTNRSMAFVRLPSVAEAVEALVLHHNALLHDRHIRISFANKDPTLVVNSDQQRRDQMHAAPQMAQHGEDGANGMIPSEGSDGAAAE